MSQDVRTLQEQALLKQWTETQSDLHAGDRLFLVSATWSAEWRGFVSGERLIPPGSIRNADLVDHSAVSERTNPSIRPQMMPGEDYELVPLEVWDRLTEWYTPDYIIERRAIENPQKKDDIIVEVYPLHLLCQIKKDSTPASLLDSIRISKASTEFEFKSHAYQSTGLNPAQYDMCILDQVDASNVIWRPNQSSSGGDLIGALSINDGDIILFFPRSADPIPEANANPNPESNLSDSTAETRPNHVESTPPQEITTTDRIALQPYAVEFSSKPNKERVGWFQRLFSFMGTDSSSDYQSFHDNPKPRPGPVKQSSTLSRDGGAGLVVTPGLVGLGNLGNTCFMNSGLQCLSNTVPLRAYFLGNRHRKEINTKNILGTRGELATDFGTLIQGMWRTNSRAVAPRTFKATIGRFAPQFSGYQQHDSQELLIYLLDGLHEDLNRVTKKPYMQIEDDIHKSLNQVAQETWDYHKRRNDSIIVDIFHGQLKLKIECDDCKSICYACDPVVCLPVSIPTHQKRIVEVVMVFASKETTKYRFRLDVSATISELKDAIHAKWKIPLSSQFIVLATMFHFAFLKDNESIYEYTRNLNPLHCFEAIPSSVDPNHKIVTVQPLSPQRASYGGNIPLGISSVFSVNKSKITYRCLAKEIATLYKVHMRLSGFDEPITDETDLEALPFRVCRPLGGVSQGDNFEVLPFTGVLDEMGNRILCVWNERVYEQSRKETMDFGAEMDPSVMAETASTSTSSQITLQDCLKEFTKEFRLNRSNAWKCPTCKTPKLARKRYGLMRFPNILIIQLKRFQYTSHHRDKIDTLVDFPLENLSLSDCFWEDESTRESPIYDLYAVSNHMGGLGGGHYTAYCKNSYDGQWYLFDDSSVAQVSPKKVVSSSAYVLFYMRRGFDMSTAESAASVSDPVAAQSDPNATASTPTAPANDTKGGGKADRGKSCGGSPGFFGWLTGQ